MASEVKASWPAGVTSAASVGGTLYGIPNEIDVYALNYNKALFKQAGIAAPPKTWDEFKDAAKKLTNKEAGQQGFGMINSWAAGVVHPLRLAARLQRRRSGQGRQAGAGQPAGHADLPAL